MPVIEDFFDEIDTARLRRVKELSEIKRSFDQIQPSDPLGIASKTVVVLAYASWEGFYNECVQWYLKFLVENGGKVRDRDWMLLVSALNAEFESMKDRNHSLESRRDFVEALQEKLDCGFDAVEGLVVEARSNLDFKRLSENYSMLSFDVGPMQSVRNRLDKELVKWRHAVAHGDSPDLTKLDAHDHINFTSSMLLKIADQFQEAMLDRI